MELNFDKLFGKAPEDAVNIPASISNEPSDWLKALQIKVESERDDITRFREVYKQYQQNIYKSGQLLTEIRKGILSGENIYTLFLLAIRAISCMTSNQMLYDEVNKNIQDIYGRGLQEQSALDLELVETQNRLNKLNDALAREQDPDCLKRISRAIEEHERRVWELQQNTKNNL